MSRLVFKDEVISVNNLKRIKFRTLEDLMSNSRYIFNKGSMYSNPYARGLISLPIKNTLDFNSPVYVSNVKEYLKFSKYMREIMSPAELNGLCGREFNKEDFSFADHETFIILTIRSGEDIYTLYLIDLDMFEIIE